MDDIVAATGVVVQELALFAAIGFLLFGIDDLLVDLVWLVRAAWRKLAIYTRHERACVGTLTRSARPGRLAIFVPAWDEADVIGAMLRNSLATLRYADYRIFVGCYPNDPATIAIVEAIAARDSRIQPVLTTRPGPTTKADCLNAIFAAMIENELACRFRYKAIVLHDAEDVVHSEELRVFDAMIERAALVQLPVLPLIDPGSRWIGGHYADEFAESHGKELVVREAIGAAMPSAGVACAIERGALEALVEGRVGPFDPVSLTEDYEIGLRLAELGHRGLFVRLPAASGRPVVMTREHFPATLDAAVRQKSRWMVGIALSGWDRMGWRGGVAERWMRLRDRRSVLAAVITFAAYVALLLWGGLWLWEQAMGRTYATVSPTTITLSGINLALFGWRLVMRFAFVSAAYGVREGARSVPRVLIANIILMLAARRALACYFRARKSGETRWDKTVHVFPEAVPAE